MTIAGNIVDCSGLKFTWTGEDRPVIDIPALSMLRGERIFLHGPSGCGKTTLLSLLSAIMKPQAGALTVNGIDLMSLTGARGDKFRAGHLGLIFQQFNLLPFLGVLDNVTLPCRFSAERRVRATESGYALEEEAERLLISMGLERELFTSRSTMQLSVGQQQRVAAARALIGRPSLIIADEPTSALDTDSRSAFLELLFNEVGASGASLLFVSHDRSLAGAFDRSIDMQSLNAMNSSVASS